MKYVFYDCSNIIAGKSTIMYKGKWYVVLYACTAYVIVKIRNKYTKIDRYDVEDCEYNNFVYDDGGNIRKCNNTELLGLIRDGEYVISTNYDADEIEACKEDMELYKSTNFKLFFLSGMLAKMEINSGNEELFESFKSFIFGLTKIVDNRKNRITINRCVVNSFKPKYYSLINALLVKYGIICDTDSFKCLSYQFIIELLHIIESE